MYKLIIQLLAVCRPLVCNKTVFRKGGRERERERERGLIKIIVIKWAILIQVNKLIIQGHPDDLNACA